MEEKKLIGSLQKFSVEDGPGIRTTIFLKGCPLNCKWCHNPELISSEPQLIQSPNNCIGCGHCQEACPQGAIAKTEESGILIDRSKCKVCFSCARDCYANALRPAASPMSVEEILSVAVQDKDFYDSTGGGITISGGELLMHAGFVNQLIDEAAKQKIHVCLDTSGYGNSQSLLALALKENVTTILYDLKSIDDTIHRKYTGASNRLILSNLKMLAENPRVLHKITMRMPLLAGVNDSRDIIRRTGQLYKKLGLKRVCLLPYHNLGISKARNLGNVQEQFRQPSENRIAEIESYFREALHLDVDILGRV